MSDLFLIGVDFAREMLVNLMVVSFYAAFGRFVLNVGLHAKSIFLCYGIHSCAHIVARYLMANAPLRFLLIAADMIVTCRILWKPMRGLTFWTNFFFAMVSEIFVCECLVMNAFMAAVPDAGKIITVLDSRSIFSCRILIRCF